MRVMIRTCFALTLSAALALAPVAVRAAEDCSTDAMLVFDGSGSMAEMGFNLLNQPRILEARDAVRRAMPLIAPVRRLGLIVYGPGAGAACSNIDLRFGPTENAGDRVTAEVEATQPDGETPLTASVARAAQVLDFQSRPGLIVLVTDGKETCGGAPCQLAAVLAAEAQDLTVHVIGFKVRSEHFGWNRFDARAGGIATAAECLSDITGGRYVSAETVEELAEALETTLGCQLIGGLPASRLRAG